MRRTTVALTEDLAEALDRAARRERTSASAVVRSALAHHLGLDESRPRELGFAALGRSGRARTARDMESLLEEAWDEPPRRS